MRPLGSFIEKAFSSWRLWGDRSFDHTFNRLPLLVHSHAGPTGPISPSILFPPVVSGSLSPPASSPAHLTPGRVSERHRLTALPYTCVPAFVCVRACVRVSVCADAPPSASAVCLSQLMSLPVPVSATTRYCSFCFYSKTIYIQCGQTLMLVIIFSTYGLCDYKKPKQITPVDDKYLHIFSLCIWPVRTRKV